MTVGEPVRALLVGLGLLGAAAAAPATPDPPVLTDTFSYRVDGLKVKGVVCRPDTRSGRPLLNLVHGGIDSAVDLPNCQRFARLGYVVAASALRGQDGSEGRPEVCLGEVEDVRALARLVRTRYATDPRRQTYLGVSLGGCVAIKAAARDPEARAVVTLLAPTDFAQQVEVMRATRPDAVDRWTRLLGGAPDAVPDAYEKRRPLLAARELRAPLLTVAAANDPLIPLRQACDLRDARRAAGHGVVEVRQTRDGQPSPVPTVPWRRCEGEQPRADLPRLRHRDVLLVYSDLDHHSTPLMWRVAERYLEANITPPTFLERLWRRLTGRG